MKSLIVVFMIILTGSFVLLFIGKTTEAIVGFVISIISLFFTILYGYPQYQSAKEARNPVATIELQEEGFLDSCFKVVVHNHCNQTITGWCYPSATMSGRLVNFNTPAPAEPFEIKIGEHKKVYEFDFAESITRSTNYMNHEDWLRDEMAKPMRAVERLMIQAATDPRNAKNLFRLKLVIQYSGILTNVEGKPISKEYYFDFQKRRMIDTSLPEV